VSSQPPDSLLTDNSLVPEYRTKSQHIEIANRSFENVIKLNYLGMTVINQNLINEEVVSR
jgi:hypothetical protein